MMAVIADKKAKGTKKRCGIKQKLMFENYKDFLFNNKTLYRPQERFKSYCHVMYTEEVNKTALSSNENKRLKLPYKITTCPYGNHDQTVINIKIINSDDCVNEIKMNIIKSGHMLPIIRTEY